jgi:nucleoside-diphosphate-sugar epimerase/putative sterol carrier protein
MKRVAITGAAGHLGQALIRRLAQSPRPYKIRAIDLREPRDLPREVAFEPADVRDAAALERLFEGMDAVIHLAFVVEKNSRDKEAVEAINIGGTQNVFRAAQKRGVKHILYASSIAAYGVHPENRDGPLTEDAPIRGNKEFYYSHTKAEVERFIDTFQAEHPELVITRFRPGVFLGPNSSKSRDLASMPFLPYIATSSCPQHLIHQDDIAQAFELALDSGKGGAFNLCTEEPLPMSEWARHAGKRAVPFPEGALRIMEALYRSGKTQVDPVWYRFTLKYPIVVDSAKARRELGWKPVYPTTASVLRALAGERSGWGSRPVKVLLGGLVQATRLRGYLVSDPVKFTGTQGALDIVLTGTRPSAWHFWVEKEKAGFAHGRHKKARATLTMTEADFLKLMTGELTWTTACMIGKARLEGDGGFMMIAGVIVTQLRAAVDSAGEEKKPVKLFKRVLQRAMGLESGRSA